MRGMPKSSKLVHLRVSTMPSTSLSQMYAEQVVIGGRYVKENGSSFSTVAVDRERDDLILLTPL